MSNIYLLTVRIKDIKVYPFAYFLPDKDEFQIFQYDINMYACITICTIINSLLNFVHFYSFVNITKGIEFKQKLALFAKYYNIYFILDIIFLHIIRIMYNFACSNFSLYIYIYYTSITYTIT